MSSRQTRQVGRGRLPSCSSTARGLLGAGRGWISPLPLLLAPAAELVLATATEPASVDCCCCCWEAGAAAPAAADGSTTTATCGGRRETSSSSLPCSSSSDGTGSAPRRPRSHPRKPASDFPGPPASWPMPASAACPALVASSWPSAASNGGGGAALLSTRQAAGWRARVPAAVSLAHPPAGAGCRLRREARPGRPPGARSSSRTSQALLSVVLSL